MKTAVAAGGHEGGCGCGCGRTVLMTVALVDLLVSVVRPVQAGACTLYTLVA